MHDQGPTSSEGPMCGVCCYVFHVSMLSVRYHLGCLDPQRWDLDRGTWGVFFELWLIEHNLRVEQTP